MQSSILKIATVLLMLAGSFSSCQQEEQQNEETSPISPCDSPYFQNPINPDSILPWVYEIIEEHLENGTHGTITQCEYRDGFGYLFEPLGNSIETGYSFLTCDSTVLYEGEEKPIEVTYPELNIKRRLFLLGIYPSWEKEETSDEFPCYAINPFSLPQVREMLYKCPWSRCRKFVSIATYRDGVGFLMVEHLRSDDQHWKFLDCQGNLLCESVVGQGTSRLCPELNIKIDKIIIETVIPLNVILNQ